MYPKLEMLLKWEKAPEQAQESIVAFVGLAEAMKDEKPDDMMRAFNKLIGEFHETELERRPAKRGEAEGGG